MDCGEGTIYEIIREFGPGKYQEKLCNLKFIFSSHLHSDHHIGLVHILLEREKSFNQLNRNPGPLTLIVADAVYDFLKLYDQNFEPIRHLFNVELLPHKDKLSLPDEQAKRIGLEKMEIIRVPHCFQSCGCAITMKDSNGENFKIVYSGDCLQNESLLKIGSDCDLLIHEATFSEHFEDEAVKKRHSTSEQAIEIRDKMDAKFVILTHFSNRFSKIPLRPNKFDDRVGIACDHMRLHRDTLKKSSLFFHVLEVLYNEDLKTSKLLTDRKKISNELLNKLIREQKAS